MKNRSTTDVNNQKILNNINELMDELKVATYKLNRAIAHKLKIRSRKARLKSEK